MFRNFVEAIALDRALLLLDRRAGELRAYDALALQLWSLAQRSSDLEEMRAAARRDPLTAERAELILGDWQAAGLLIAGPEEPPASAEPIPDDWRSAPVPEWACQWFCRLGPVTVRMSVESPKGAKLIRRILEHFDTEKGTAAAHLEVRDTGPGEAAVVLDGAEILRTGDLGLLLGAVHQTLLNLVHPNRDWHALLHAAAVARNGAAIALAAPSGSGKSTLTAGLVASGFEYLADDLVAITAPDGVVVPWPMPLSLKQGSWAVLQEHVPGLAHAPEITVKGQQARLLLADDASWSRAPVPLRAIVFPRWEAGESPEIERIDTTDAVLRLMNDRVWLGYPLTAARIRAFVSFLEEIPCFALRYPSLAQAERLVRSISD